MSALTDWVGRTREQRDRLETFPARAMAGLLDGPPDGLGPGAALPPGWHWLYFNHPVRSSELGPDGHERRGGFLPPVPLPRRMWAGGRLRLGRPLRLGDDVTRTSKILTINEKEGSSGPLVFVTVEHRIENGRGGSIREEQDLVYVGERRAADPTSSGSTAPPGARVLDRLTTDPVVLFRFSALTYNGHRIHYDHPYATGTEGYPGLVVHGPLLALLLLRAADGAGPDKDARLAAFSYRAVAPVFCDEEILLMAGDSRAEDDSSATPAPVAVDLWASTEERGVAMKATVEWSPSRPEPGDGP